MNSAQTHLLFNHLPIIVPIVGLLILVSGFVLKAPTVKNTAFCVFILGALCAIPAINSGEGTEQIILRIMPYSHAMIHEHEEISEKFALLSYLLGALSGLALWAGLKNKKFVGTLNIIVGIFAVITLFFAVKTGSSGGKIRHATEQNDTIPTVEHP